MLKKLITFFRPVILFTYQTYWYIFRPKTFGAKVILTNNGDVLLVKTTYGYKLTLPGGGMKKHEKPEEAAIRELKEELGIEVSNLTYLGSEVSTVEYKVDTIHAFHAELPNRNVITDNLEIEAVEWQPLNAVTNAGPVTMKLIEMYKNLGKV